MYNLWKENKITKPSEYWNASIGDKIVMRAFYQKLIAEKNKTFTDLKNKNADIFPVVMI